MARRTDRTERPDPADRRVFTLDRESWNAFIAALDAPHGRHPRLERLFAGTSVFGRLQAAGRQSAVARLFNVGRRTKSRRARSERARRGARDR